MGKKLTVTIKGRPIRFQSAFDTDAEALDALAAGVETIESSSTRDFGRDLVQRAREGVPSPRMVAWIHRLACECLTTEADVRRAKMHALPRLDLTPVVQMMDRAAEAQKRAPKIELGSGASRIVLRRAGPRARLPGTISITDGRPYGEGSWYGRIMRDGTFRPGRDCTDGVAAALAELAKDPARVAAQNGIATGQCCFCSRLLSTRESRSAGYGQICAGRYGLPWGDTTIADDASRSVTTGLQLPPDGPTKAERRVHLESGWGRPPAADHLP